jgi:hypothetical protein
MMTAAIFGSRRVLILATHAKQALQPPVAREDTEA